MKQSFEASGSRSLEKSRNRICFPVPKVAQFSLKRRCCITKRQFFPLLVFRTVDSGRC